jgi:hypothetical protein
VQNRSPKSARALGGYGMTRAWAASSLLSAQKAYKALSRQHADPRRRRHLEHRPALDPHPPASCRPDPRSAQACAALPRLTPGPATPAPASGSCRCPPAAGPARRVGGGSQRRGSTGVAVGVQPRRAMRVSPMTAGTPRIPARQRDRTRVTCKFELTGQAGQDSLKGYQGRMRAPLGDGSGRS